MSSIISFLCLLCLSIYVFGQCNVQLCDDSCYYHGSCQNDGSCICDEGWTSDDCSIPTCNNCNHGSCTTNGDCNCFPGWQGDDCSEAICAGIHPCCNLDGFCSEEGVMPDLIIDENNVDPYLSVETFDNCNCAVDEGCTESGTRLLLRFGTYTQNIGNADLQVGLPGDDIELWEWHQCHEHSHFKDFATFDLVGSSQGHVAQSHKSGFCLVDTFATNDETLHVYSCDVIQGLQMGWVDIYSSFLDCQWVDVTDIDGTLSWNLEMEINPEKILPESNYANNLLIYPLTCNNCNPDNAICFFGQCVCTTSDLNGCITVPGIEPFLPISKSPSNNPLVSPSSNSNPSASSSNTQSHSTSRTPSTSVSSEDSSFNSITTDFSTFFTFDTFSSLFSSFIDTRSNSNSNTNSEKSSSNSEPNNGDRYAISYLLTILFIIVIFI